MSSLLLRSTPRLVFSQSLYVALRSRSTSARLSPIVLLVDLQPRKLLDRFLKLSLYRYLPWQGLTSVAPALQVQTNSA